MAAIASIDTVDLGALTRRLELDSLRLLSVVAREGSYAKAARVEPLTASAISKRIAELERAMGYLLLERSAYGVRPTLAGELVLNHWCELAASLKSMLSVSSSVNRPDKVKMAVVADSDTSRFLVFDCLSHIDALEDDANISVTRTSSGWLPVEFDKLQAHMAIWSLSPGEGSVTTRASADHLFDRFHSGKRFRLAAEVCVAVVRNDHPLAALGLIAGLDLEQYELVSHSGAFDHIRSRMSVNGENTMSPGRPRVTVARPSWSHQITSTLEFLESVPTGYVALVPTSSRYVIHRYPGLRCLALTEDLGCADFGVVLRDDAWLSERLRLVERLAGGRLVAVADHASPSQWDTLSDAQDSGVGHPMSESTEELPSLPCAEGALTCNGPTAEERFSVPHRSSVM